MMANFTPRSARQTRSPLSTDLPGKMYAFLVSTCEKTFMKTTEHPWTKAMLGRGYGGKMFNSNFNA